MNSREAFDNAKNRLRWLKNTAKDERDNSRIAGYVECLEAWQAATSTRAVPDDVSELLQEAHRVTKPVTDKERQGEKIDAETMNFRMGGAVPDDAPPQGLLKIILDDITEAQEIADNAIMRIRQYPEESVTPYTIVDIANILDEIPKKIAALSAIPRDTMLDEMAAIIQDVAEEKKSPHEIRSRAIDLLTKYKEEK